MTLIRIMHCIQQHSKSRYLVAIFSSHLLRNIRGIVKLFIKNVESYCSFLHTMCRILTRCTKFKLSFFPFKIILWKYTYICGEKTSLNAITLVITKYSKCTTRNFLTGERAEFLLKEVRNCIESCPRNLLGIVFHHNCYLRSPLNVTERGLCAYRPTKNIVRQPD